MRPCDPASLLASATPPRLPLDHTTTLQHRRQGTDEDADVLLSGPKMAETVSKAHALSFHLLPGRRDGRIPVLNRLHIGGAAYFVWAYLPTGGSCT